MAEDPADPREALRAEHADVRRRIVALTGSFEEMVEAARLTALDDEHDPEGATVAFERSQTGALLGAARRRLAEIEAALARVAEGAYGRCEACGEAIPAARLQARPAARTCVGCAAEPPLSRR